MSITRRHPSSSGPCLYARKSYCSIDEYYLIALYVGRSMIPRPGRQPHGGGGEGSVNGLSCKFFPKTARAKKGTTHPGTSLLNPPMTNLLLARNLKTWVSNSSSLHFLENFKKRHKAKSWSVRDNIAYCKCKWGLRSHPHRAKVKAKHFFGVFHFHSIWTYSVPSLCLKDVLFFFWR